jgi:hypothetical protein
MRKVKASDVRIGDQIALTGLVGPVGMAEGKVESIVHIGPEHADIALTGGPILSLHFDTPVYRR